jgi:hypothetical protein
LLASWQALWLQKKVVVVTAKLVHIAASKVEQGCGVGIRWKMFKLTRQEQAIVAFLVGAILLGTFVRQWRVRHPSKATWAAGTMEKRD